MENQVEYQAKTLIQAMHMVLSALSIPEEIYQNETNLVHLVELMAMGMGQQSGSSDAPGPLTPPSDLQ